jgi:probable sporulation protein (polysaccharide deacetylase family)
MAVVLAGIIKSGYLAENEFEPVTHGNLNKAQVALACNVFWGEEFLPAMLAVLKEEEVKTTFFVGGSWAKKNEVLVKAIVEDGHEIGNHTYSHPHPNNLSSEQNKEQILQTEKLLAEIAGVKTRLYAPPYGEYNKNVLTAAHEIGYTTVMWTIDTIDWQRPSAEVIQRRVLDKLQNGAIILIHPTKPTLEALPGLIKEIKSKGYSVSTVSGILKVGQLTVKGRPDPAFFYCPVSKFMVVLYLHNACS